MIYMFSKSEIKRNLLGGLEVALFMPQARTRFGNSTEEAVRSFFLPLMLMPLGIVMLYLQPELLNIKKFANAFAIMYCLQTAISTCVFAYCVYWLSHKMGRREHFNQFVIALNWLSIPATVVLLPVFALLMSGAYGWQDLYPLAISAVIYTYAFTGYMAKNILRVPWEIGGFIATVGFMIGDFMDRMLHIVNSIV
jgi:hypothetical protein